MTSAEVLTRPHGSFAAPPSAPDFDELDAAWRNVDLPYAMPRTVAPGASDEIVTTWFRLPAQSVRSAAGGSVLYLPRWQTIGKIAVYVDGRLLERSRGGAVWNGYNHPLWIVLGNAGDPPAQDVLIRMDHLRSAGGALSSAWLGDPDALRSARFVRVLFQTQIPQVASAAFLILGLFAFGVWVRRRQETIYLLFFASSVLAYARCMHYYMGPEPLPMPEDWFGWLTVNSLGWLVIVAYSLAFRLHGRRYPRLERSLLIAMSAASFITLPPVSVGEMGSLAPLAYLLVAAVVIILSVVMCVAAWKSRSLDGLLFSGWNMLNLPLMVHDWMLQNHLLDPAGVYLFPYTILGTSFFFMGLILRRYLRALSDMETANARLELRLREREAQLNESHEQLRVAEREQALNDERQRLIRDMHDGFGSSLISALAAVESTSSDSLDVAQVLRECIDDLKLTIDSLEPVDSDLLLLLASLRFRIAPRLERAGVRLQWDVAEDIRLEWLSPDSSLQILRILQEAFTNVIKHARASVIRVQARSGAREVIVAVEDDGEGFDVQRPSAAGRGLANLKRRASSLRASVQWESRPGCTRMELSLPVVPEAAGRMTLGG